MMLAPAAAPQSPTAGPIVGRLIDTEVAGMYHAELHLAPRSGDSTSFASVEDTVAAATSLTTGEEHPAVAIMPHAGEFELRDLLWQWKDSQSGEYTSEIEPAMLEGYEDAFLERTRAGVHMVGLVDGESVFAPR
jgi:hypothetical protein